MALDLSGHIPNRERDLTVDFGESLSHAIGGPPQLRMTAPSSNAHRCGIFQTLHHSWENRLDARLRATEQLSQLNHHENFDTVPISCVDRKSAQTAPASRAASPSSLINIQNHIQDCRSQIAKLRESLLRSKSNSAGRSNERARHSYNHRARAATALGLGTAMRGLYSAMAAPIQVLKGCTQTTADGLDQASELIEADPLDSIKKTGISEEVFSRNEIIGDNSALLLLAIAELKSGIQEVKHATHKHKELNRSIMQIEQEIASLDLLGIPPSSIGHRACATEAHSAGMYSQAQSMMTCLRSIKEVNREILTFLQKQNRADAAMGACSIASGSAVLTKASVGLSAKAAISATDGNAVAAALDHIAGFVTLGLEPVVGLSAVASGAYKVHKSRQKRDAYRAAKDATDKRIEVMGNEYINELLEQHKRQGNRVDADDAAWFTRFADFYSLKSKQRDQFFTSYARWNNSFLAGSSIYTASVLTKVGVAGAVAAGTAGAAAAHPAVAGGILAATIAGLVMMSASSQHSLIDYRKQRRYQSYYTDDDPELNRTFLESMDVLNWDNRNRDTPPLDGALLQTAFYKQIYQREEQRQKFLLNVADQIDKRYEEYVYTGDATDRGAKPTAQQHIQRVAKRAAEDSLGRLKAASSFLIQTAKLKPSGTQAAKQAWNDSRGYLTRTSLKTWLAKKSPEAQTTQIELFEGMLDTQTAYLHRKLEAKIKVYRNVACKLTGTSASSPDTDPIENVRISTVGSLTDATQEHAFKEIFHGLDADIRHIEDVRVENHPVDVSRGLTLKEMLVDLDKDLEHDQRLYRDALAVQAQFKNLKQHLEQHKSPLTHEDSQLLAVAIDQFISVQKGELVDPHARRTNLAASHDKLATYLMKGAPRRYRDLRGKLHETLMQATRQFDLCRARLKPQHDNANSTH
ncbi:hypothetical protein DFQ28_010010 [Apophysomyces sp. BC1034]|nr:hypothetical protein DFQ28_010010 [Apophysomyces sp. BC1034]